MSSASRGTGADRGPAPTQVASFPFQLEDARVYVPVRIGADSTRWFILDTGADGTGIDSRVADALHLVATDTISIGGAGRNRAWQAQTAPLSFSVGGVSLTPTSVSVSPLDSLLAPSTGRTIPGVIGAEFFREHVVEVDFGRHIINVYDPRTFRYDGHGAVVPITFTSNLPMASGSLTVGSGQRIPVHLLVDLGAKSTLLVGEPFADRTELLSKLPTHFRSPLGAGLGGETWYDWVRVPRLEVAGYPQVSITDFVAGVSAKGTLRSTWYDALLGVDFLRRYRVVFDYSRERIIFERLEPQAPPAEADMSGLFLLRPDGPAGPVVVHDVVAGSPAARADIRPGDVLEAVDGQKCSVLSLSAIRSRLRTGDGEEVQIGIVRDGVPTVEALTLHRMV